jgi:hypothetical protein
MKLKNYSWLLGAAVACAIALPAFADTKDATTEDPNEYPVANCDLTGYKTATLTYPNPVPIPDFTTAGGPGTVTVGPLSFPPENGTILDVVLEFHGSHTWVGDLRAELRYDSNCDGGAEAGAVVICRPRGTATTTTVPCGTATSGFGASGDLLAANTYRWTDATASVISEGVNPASIASGCYRPSTVGGTPLSAFNGLPKNGCWYLTISDYAAGDIGAIGSWSIHLLNEVTPTVQSSWGTLKAIYR